MAASRVGGAVLALTAAALLATSIVTSMWWSGHPSFNGREITMKEIHIGPLGATGCNVGGDGVCTKLSVDPTFETIGFAETGATGLLIVTTLLLAIAVLKGAARRRSFAVFVIVGAVLCTGLAIILLVTGPHIRSEQSLPIGYGLYLYGAGIASAFVGSVLAMRPIPRQRMQLAPARQSLQHMAPPKASHPDLQAILAEDALRPTSFGGAPIASPGGALPGPSGPLGAIGHSGPQAQPLFSSAPQLRPLYDATPGQGGTGGFVPKPAAQLPMRAPTPIPRDRVSALAGIPTPASVEAQRPVTVAGLVPPLPPPPTPNPETDRDLLGAGRSKPRSIPPPNRGKAPSMAPKPRAAPTVATAIPPPPAPAPPPMLPMPKMQLGGDGETSEFDAQKTYEQSKPRAATPRPPTRLATEDPGDQDVNTDVRTQAIDDTGSRPTETFETSTNESTNFAPKPTAPATPAPAKAQPAKLQAARLGPPKPIAAPQKKPVVPFPERTSATMETQAAPADTGADTNDPDEAATARANNVQTDMDLPVVPPAEPAADHVAESAVESISDPVTAPTPLPAPIAPVLAAIVDVPVRAARAAEADAKPTERAPTKIPISTAPDSLPPPSEKQSAGSGPSPACPQCEAPMAWVEAHLRFYCKSCKMYF